MNVRTTTNWCRSVCAVAVWALTVLAVPCSAPAQFTAEPVVRFTHEVVHGFEAIHVPARLVAGGDGIVYGMTSGPYGITSGLSAFIFRISADGAMVPVTPAVPIDGSAGLIANRDGSFYAGGGRSVFRIMPDGSFTPLYTFECGDRCPVMARLVGGSDGNVYGTIHGDSDVLFRITPSGVLAILHTFECVTDGCLPFALLQGRDGGLYGTTRVGGPRNQGTVFRMIPDGAFTTLHSFAYPELPLLTDADLTEARDGNLYGTTVFGGTHGDGVLFRVTPSGEFTVLHSFDCAADGCRPDNLIQATDGNFYGTTRYSVSGGARTGVGMVFRMSSNGIVAPLHFFDDSVEGFWSTGLVEANDGKLYGTTSSGGGARGGTLFAITTAGVLDTLYAFMAPFSCRVVFPSSPCQSIAIIQGRDGDFYGTTQFGGARGEGAVFRMSTSGALAIVHSFDCRAEGCAPEGGLVEGADGNFYGTAPTGGEHGGGTVFRIAPTGAFTVLHSFDRESGISYPNQGLTLVSDGTLYGTTGSGALFALAPDGALRMAHVFQCSGEGCGPGRLVQASNGQLYGTLVSGGAHGGGAMFSVTPSGVVSVVHSFDCDTEGCVPRPRLIPARDGNVYGTAAGRGNRLGSIFKVTPGDVVTTLHSFTIYEPLVDVLIGASDGNVYGTAGFDRSAIVKVSPAGTVSVMEGLRCATQGCIVADLIQASDGHFYGTASAGGPGAAGVVFRLKLDCPLEGCPPTSIVAAVLPAARSHRSDVLLTAFATVVNAGTSRAAQCRVEPPAGFSSPWTFVYQVTDPATNLPIGWPNTPARVIEPGASQGFVFGVTPGPFGERTLAMRFVCENTPEAPSFAGVNDFVLVAEGRPVPDTIAMVATQSGDGVVRIPGEAASQSFAIGTANAGATGTVTVSGDTGQIRLPVIITVCETDTRTAACLAPPTPAVTVTFPAGTTRSFAFFAQATGSIPFDPGVNRVFARLTENGITRGATSAAVCTAPNTGC